MSFFFFSNWSFAIMLHSTEKKDKKIIFSHLKLTILCRHPKRKTSETQDVFSHRDDVTYVWGCAGSSPRVTLLPWISLKHFSQKWYLSAIRPYLGELQPAHTVAAQVNRRTGGRMQSEWSTQQQPQTEHGQRIVGRTHTQAEVQVSHNAHGNDPATFKLKKK